METKIFLNILLLFIPITIFGAIIQITRGSNFDTFNIITSTGNLIMILLNSVVSFLLLLTYESTISPFLNAIKIQQQLHRIAFSGFLNGISALITASVYEYEVVIYSSQVGLIILNLTRIISEIIFTVTLLQFTFIQSPPSLRATLQGFLMVRNFEKSLKIIEIIKIHFSGLIC